MLRLLSPTKTGKRRVEVSNVSDWTWLSNEMRNAFAMQLRRTLSLSTSSSGVEKVNVYRNVIEDFISRYWPMTMHLGIALT